jgi:hypothetical protein
MTCHACGATVKQTYREAGWKREVCLPCYMKIGDWEAQRPALASKRLPTPRSRRKRIGGHPVG